MEYILSGCRLWFNRVSLNWCHNCSAHLLNFITNDFTKLLYVTRVNMLTWLYSEQLLIYCLYNSIYYTTSRLYSVLRGVYLKWWWIKIERMFVTKFWLCDGIQDQLIIWQMNYVTAYDLWFSPLWQTQNYQFGNEVLIYAEIQNKLGLRNSVKIDLYDFWEITHFEFLMDTQAQRKLNLNTCK